MGHVKSIPPWNVALLYIKLSFIILKNGKSYRKDYMAEHIMHKKDAKKAPKKTLKEKREDKKAKKKSKETWTMGMSNK